MEQFSMLKDQRARVWRLKTTRQVKSVLGKQIGEFNPEITVLGKKDGPDLRNRYGTLSKRVAKCGQRYGIDVKAVSPAAVLRKCQEERSNVDTSMIVHQPLKDRGFPFVRASSFRSLVLLFGGLTAIPSIELGDFQLTDRVSCLDESRRSSYRGETNS